MAMLAPTLPAPVRGSELQKVLRAERAGSPFIVFRDDADQLQVLDLSNGSRRRTVGRQIWNDIALPWDGQVSRVHAELERIGDCWAVTDDGLSTNGTFVNGSRVTARRRLDDGDSVRVGTSVLIFHEPHDPSADNGGPDTEQCLPSIAPPHVSPTQRRVLIALCRPFKRASGFAAPATNQQIADELYLSVDRVKTHLRILFEKFGLTDLPQNRKRLELVQRALLSGLVTPGDL
jgi:DNA-binding CsgD family transcriptional regulator